MSIWICGVPRSGKTTFCKTLAQQNRVTIISTEALRNGFQKMDAENFIAWGMGKSEKRQKDFPVFLFEFVKWNEFFSRQECIVDCALIELEKVYKFANTEDKIICFGFGGKSVIDILAFIRKREKSDDYTKNLSDEKLLKIWGDVSKIDNENLVFCKEHNIKYIDCTTV